MDSRQSALNRFHCVFNRTEVPISNHALLDKYAGQWHRQFPHMAPDLASLLRKAENPTSNSLRSFRHPGFFVFAAFSTCPRRAPEV